ncbi:site-specific integrase [Nevskia ramosa]|uniref:site-specific integrase n=1 Tax=Nevskia ramosa TaxID=64002 RepID=UPI003D137467
MSAAQTPPEESDGLTEGTRDDDGAAQQNAALELLFAAHAVIRTDTQQGLLAFTQQLIETVSWFGPAILRVLGTSKLPPSSVSVQASPRLSGQLVKHWEYATIQAACQATVPGVRAAAAVVSLALVARYKDSSTAISKTALEDFAALVRSVIRKVQHPQARLFRTAMTAETPAALAALITSALLPADDSDFARRWPREWQPWLEALAIQPTAAIPPRMVERERPSVPDVPEPETTPSLSAPTTTGYSGSRERSTGVSRGRHVSERKQPFPTERTRFPVAPIEEADYLEEIEPLEEVAPAADFVAQPTLSPGASALRRPQERALCFQSIRQQNTELLTQHIEVLSPTESQYVRRAAAAAFEAALDADDLKTAAELVCHDLVSCTGCTWEVVAEIELSPVSLSKDDRLVIALNDGVLWRPVMRPKGIASTSLPTGMTAAPVVQCLPLPLPPSVAERLRTVCSRAQIQTLGDLIGDVSSSKQHVKEILVGAATVPRLSVSISRARRLVATRVMECSHDPAATVLLCGDDLGKSNAPTFYYAPRVRDLAVLYKAAIWPIFGDQPDEGGVTFSEVSNHRVGTTAVIDDGPLKLAFTELATRIRSFSRKLATGSVDNLYAFHNARSAYVLNHFCAITTHRPTRRLFELHRSAVDTESRLALIEDKRVDVAHLFRPVAMSDLLCRQLDLHLAHLQFLADRLPAGSAAQDAAQNALRCKGPLFFFIEDDGTTSADLESWSRHQPETLKQLRANWYRHVFATRMRELGGAATDVLVQCGHLESAGYPFGSTGTLSPTRLTKSLASTLTKFEEALGFALCASALAIRVSDTPPPLFAWSGHIQRHAQSVRSIDWKYLRRLASAKRLNKELGKDLGRSILTDIAPGIVQLQDRLDRNEDVRLSAAEKPAYKVTSQQAAAILERIESAEIDDAIRFAARLYISGVLRHLKCAYRLEICAFGNVFHYRIGEPTPFFRDSLVALRQVKNLRTQFVERAAEIRSKYPFTWQVLSQVLLAGVDSRVELDLALGGASSDRREGLVNLDGPCLVVDSANGQGRAIGFSGLAALAMTGLDRPASTSLCEASETAYALFKMQFAGCAPHDALDLLLESVSIANRYELSGLSRYAMSPEGSIPALFEVQKAFLVGGLPGPIKSAAIAAAGPDQTETARQSQEGRIRAPKLLKPDRLRALSDAKAFVKKIQQACRLVAHGGKTRPATRTDVIANLEVLCGSIPADGPALVEYAVAYFALDIARHGTPGKRDLATSSIRTYVSIVTNLLNEQTAGRDLSMMGAEDLDHEYQKIVDEHQDTNSQRRTAGQLLRMHAVLTAKGLAEPLEDSALKEFLDKSERAVDADLVLDAEFELAIAWLEAQKIASPGAVPEIQALHRRTLQVAIVILKLLRHSGCRFSEVAFLRHGDVFLEDDALTLLVRPHLDRSLKSAAARRRVDIVATDSGADIREISCYLRGERLRHGSDLRPKTRLFCDLGKAGAMLSIWEIRERISQAFAHGAGRRLWPHRLRHLSVQEKVMAAVDAANATEASNFSTWSLMSRQLASAATSLGHRRLATTISSYFHLGWALRALERRELEIDFDRKIIAGIAGITTAAAAKQKQRTVRRRDQVLLSPRKSRWEDDILVRRSRELTPIPAKAAKQGASADRPSFTTTQVVRWLRRVRTPGDLALIMCAEGFSQSDTDRLRAILDAVATDYRLAFLSDNAAQRPPIELPRTTETFGHDDIAQKIDALSSEDRTRLVHLFTRCDRTRHAERTNAFYGSASDLLDLRSMIEQLGLPLARLRVVTVETATAGKAAMTFDPGEGEAPFDLLRWVFYATVVSERGKGQ